MFVFELLALAAVVYLVLVLFTQLLVPAYTGEPLFPAFRKSAVRQEITQAEKVLEDVAEAVHLKELTSEIERRKAQLEKK